MGQIRGQKYKPSAF